MNASALVVQLLNGFAGASTLVLLASGLSLIFGVSRVVNFARWEPMVAGHGHDAGQSLESTAASER